MMVELLRWTERVINGNGEDSLDMSTRRIHVRSASREVRDASQALLKAVENGKVRIVTSLLENSQVDVNIQDGAQRTTLLIATQLARQDVRTHMVRLLLRHGADVNVQDCYGRTSLAMAAMTPGLDDVSRLLVRKVHCDPNIADKEGNTPLNLAVNANNASFIRILVNSAHMKHSLEVDKANNNGVSPLMHAFKLRFGECVKILVREAGADTSAITNKDVLQNMLDSDEIELRSMRNSSQMKSSTSSKTSLRLDRISLHSKGSINEEASYFQRGNDDEIQDDVFAETEASKLGKRLITKKNESKKSKKNKHKVEVYVPSIQQTDTVPKIRSTQMERNSLLRSRSPLRNSPNESNSITIPIHKSPNSSDARFQSKSVPLSLEEEQKRRLIYERYQTDANTGLASAKSHSFIAETDRSNNQSRSGMRGARHSLQPIAPHNLSRQSQKLMASMKTTNNPKTTSSSLLPTIQAGGRINLVSGTFEDYRDRAGTL